MAKTCPACGYNPIGPFIDLCPICAEPVRHVYSDEVQGNLRYSDDDEHSETPSKLHPWLIGGWIVLVIVLAFFFSDDTPWMMLSIGLCGLAWWAVVKGESLLIRLVGGSLLALFVPGFWLAAQPEALPGLDRRPNTPERAMMEMMNLLRQGSPGQLRTNARMKTISGAIYALHATVVLPMALVVPPLLSYAKRRKLGGPIWLTKLQAAGAMAVWLLLLPILAWSAWPAMQTWAEPSPFQAMQGFAPNTMPPGNRWPGKHPFLQNAAIPDDDDADDAKR